MLFLGETHLVRCDPEVRAEWLENVEIDGVDYSKGRAGNLRGNPSGTLWLTATTPVYFRLLPERPFAATDPAPASR